MTHLEKHAYASSFNSGVPACGIINSAYSTKRTTSLTMQPDYMSSSHWSGLAQNWLYPPLTSPPYFAIPPGLHPDAVKNTSRFTEQILRGPPGDNPSSLSPHLSPYGPSPSYSPPSYPLPTRGSSYYPRSPLRREISPVDPYRLAEHNTMNPSFNQMSERNSDSINDNPTGLESKSPRIMDDKAVIRPQRGRTVFSAYQLNELENVFVVDQYISGQQRRRLSSQLGLTETQVRVWFQNRRIKWRKNKIERKMRP